MRHILRPRGAARRGIQPEGTRGCTRTPALMLTSPVTVSKAFACETLSLGLGESPNSAPRPQAGDEVEQAKPFPRRLKRSWLLSSVVIATIAGPGSGRGPLAVPARPGGGGPGETPWVKPRIGASSQQRGRGCLRQKGWPCQHLQRRRRWKEAEWP